MVIAMATRRPTLQDIADKLKISTASVSRALADNPRISKSLRMKVKKTAQQMGYVPNIAARALRTGKADMAALMVPNLNALRIDGNLDVLQALDEELAQQGIRIVVSSYHQPSLVLMTMRKLQADPRLAGFLFLTNFVTEELLEAISSNDGAPTVIVNAFPERHWEKWDQFVACGTENLAGAKLATSHLISLGHEKIGALVCEPGQRDADLREEGFLAAMEEEELKINQDWVVRCDFLRGFETGRRAIHRLSAVSRDFPTALFCSSDIIGAGALRGLNEIGKRVPEDVALIGFGNHPLSVALHPPLSTVTHDGAAVGRSAAQLFLRLQKGQAVEELQLIQPAELIVRESSGQPVKETASTLSD